LKIMDGLPSAAAAFRFWTKAPFAPTGSVARCD
jgi:hypothetical protein